MTNSIEKCGSTFCSGREKSHTGLLCSRVLSVKPGARSMRESEHLNSETQEAFFVKLTEIILGKYR